MKTLLGVCLLCWSLLGQAAGPVSFSLLSVSLGDLARVVVDDVSGASLIIAPEVLDDPRQFSFVVKRVSPVESLRQFSALVERAGYQLVRDDGVYYLGKAIEEKTDVLVYMPKYRSVGYLADLIGGLLPRAAVANQRSLPIPAGQQTGQGVDTGTNVTSLFDKGDKDALVLTAKPRELDQVRRLLREVDRPIPEMLIKAVVVEVNTGSLEGSAVNLLGKLLSKGSASASIAWDGGADSKNGVTFKLGGIEAVWSAISSDTRFKIVSAPQIRVKSGATARFSVGSDTPVLGSVNYQGNGQSVQSVEYKPSGVILELKPDIRGALAELKVFQQLSSFARTETGVNNSPTLLKRELSTTVVVAQNDVVLLGGLDEEKSLQTNAGLFFMPKWLRSNTDDSSRSEIVLMLYVERVQTPGEGI